MNDLLSICIPTYNRAGDLSRLLENLILQAKPHDIAIYVSDNASTDNTREVVEAFQKRYPNIIYSRNDSNMGAEYNIANVLRMSKSRYAWCLGDDDNIYEGAIDNALPILMPGNFDLAVLNGARRFEGMSEAGDEIRVRDIPKPEVYDDRNRLLSELGWHMGWISCLIWSRRMIDGGNFDKYIGTDFQPVGVVFDYFSDKAFSARWDPRPYVCYISRTKRGPKRDFFELFAKKWFDAIESLPASYSEQARRKCIKDHGVKQGCFSPRGFLWLRAMGYYGYSDFKKYRSYLPYVTNVPVIFLLALALIPIPSFLIKPGKAIYDGLRSVFKRE